MQGKTVSAELIRKAAMLLASGRNFTFAAECAGTARSTVSRMARALKRAGLTTVSAVETASDEKLIKAVYPTALITRSGACVYGLIARAAGKRRREPDAPKLALRHREERVQLQVLFEEYERECAEAGENAVSRAVFYRRVRAAGAEIDRQAGATYTVRHGYGDEVQIDYIGGTVKMTMEDGKTAELTVCTLAWPASGYVFAAFVRKMTTRDTCGALGAAYAHFGCVSRALVPDNAKSMVIYHPRGKAAELQPSFENYCDRLGVSVMPAPPRAPQCKSCVEYSNHLIRVRVYPRLDRETPRTLEQHSEILQQLVMEHINRTVMRKNGRTREELFLLYEKPAARPLRGPVPEYRELVLGLLVPSCYIVKVKGHGYSVPAELIGTRVDASVSASSVRFTQHGRVVAVHTLKEGPGDTVLPEHMPEAHRAYASRAGRFETDEEVFAECGRLGSEPLKRWCSVRLSRGDSQRHVACSALLRSYARTLNTGACDRVLTRLCDEGRVKTRQSEIDRLFAEEAALEEKRGQEQAEGGAFADGTAGEEPGDVLSAGEPFNDDIPF